MTPHFLWRQTVCHSEAFICPDTAIHRSLLQSFYWLCSEERVRRFIELSGFTAVTVRHRALRNPQVTRNEQGSLHATIIKSDRTCHIDPSETIQIQTVETVFCECLMMNHHDRCLCSSPENRVFICDIHHAEQQSGMFLWKGTFIIWRVTVTQSYLPATGEQYITGYGGGGGTRIENVLL